MPYLDLEVFNADVAKAASGAARGLCIFAGAMKDYYYAAKIVRPKLEALSIAMAQLDEANKNLKAAEDKLSIVQAKVAELQRKALKTLVASTPSAKIRHQASRLPLDMEH